MLRNLWTKKVYLVRLSTSFLKQVYNKNPKHSEAEMEAWEDYVSLGPKENTSASTGTLCVTLPKYRTYVQVFQLLS